MDRCGSSQALSLPLADAAATTRLGIWLGTRLGRGDTLLLEGDIGAGKTHLARALIGSRLAAAGRPEDVPSPTYTLVQTYAVPDASGELEIWHADLYRLSDPGEIVELGLGEAFGSALSVIEWPERLGDAVPPTALTLRLLPDGDGRIAHLSGGERHAALLAALAAAHPDVAAGHPERPPAQDDRQAEIAAFLTSAGWGGAQTAPLAGDASARRYLRLSRGTARAVLMDAPPEEAAATAAFTRIAAWLTARGFSAPGIFAASPDRGLLLLEDLGDALVSARLDQDPAAAAALYAALTDCLLALHTHAPPDFVPALDGAALGGMLDVLAEFYIPGTGARASSAAAELPALVATAYARLAHVPPVLALRDCHAGNLIWLPERAGTARLGLLDFQDAVATHPAYDLVSALQDARRDLPPGLEARERARYAEARGLDAAHFDAIYALLGLQRGLRIMGVFARLAMAGGKPGYLQHLPRVWAHVETNLRHPALADLAQAVRAAVPAPTPERIERIAAWRRTRMR